MNKREDAGNEEVNLVKCIKIFLAFNIVASLDDEALLQGLAEFVK